MWEGREAGSFYFADANLYPYKPVQTRTLLFLTIFSTSAYAQGQLTTVPDGGNKKASISEQIGLTTVRIEYHRPGVKGREGKIWGTSVAHYGLQDLGFGPSHAVPWRAGANETTTFSTDKDILVEGKPLAAGIYGLFMDLGDRETTVIFSNIAVSWGSFYYDPTEDVLRVPVKNQPLAQPVERLRYDFLNQTDSTATVALEWENRRIPFTITAPDVVGAQLTSFRRELRAKPGFTWQSLVQAATYCLQHNRDIAQGLVWADQAITARFIGQKNFRTLSTKAALLTASHQPGEAEALMKEALPMGTMNDLHQYARTLLAQKRAKEAYEVFKFNFDKNPNQFTTNVGMGRGLSAVGDYKNALNYLKTALPQAPDPLNKTSVEAMIKQLETNQDVN